MKMTAAEEMEPKKNIVNGIEIPQLDLTAQTMLTVESQTLAHSPSDPWLFAPIAITIQKMAMKKPPQLHHEAESKTSFFLQMIIPFLLAGLGLIAAGHLLENAESGDLFKNLPDIVTLVPTLLGLKGNLEMTLGSRLSTLANLGFMDTTEQRWSVAFANLALVQCQAIVISSIAVIPAVALGHGEDTLENVLCLLFSAVATASLTSLFLGIAMIIVVIVARKYKWNPDNIVTPVAASLGDIATLALLLLIGNFMMVQVRQSVILPIIGLSIFCVIAFLGGCRARRDEFTFEVLKHGWYPIFAAMFITLGSGFVLKQALHDFPPIAAFQPLVNGVGGNLVAVQASRISTGLHRARKNKTKEISGLWVYGSLWHAFIQNNEDSIAARILIGMSIPGNLLFMVIVFLLGTHFHNSIIFTVSFLSVSLIQVATLLYLCQFLVRLLWKYRIDPDSSAIPLLTAFGDLLGTTLLYVTFLLLSGTFGLSPYT